MRIVRGYKTELDLSIVQITACLKHAGVARFAYNWGLRRYQEEYAAGRKTPNAISLHKELNALKKCNFPWMYEVSKCAPQEALRNLEKAFQRFFENCNKKKAGKLKGKVGYPRFKSKKKGIGSFRLTGTIQIFEKAVQLPRLRLLRLKEAGYLPTDAKVLNATVSEKAGRWYISVQVEEEVADPNPATGKGIGVDLGVKTLATTSEVVAYENPKALRKNLKKLARLGRRHSRKVKGSKNRQKATRKLARMHARIAHIRQNAIHQATTALAKTKPRVIVLEDLNVKGMMANKRMARAVGDGGMHEFKRQMTYKALEHGSTVNIVSRWFPSSKTCSCCGWVDEDQDLDDRVFVCLDCGYVADRDYNGAKNLAQTEENLSRSA